MSDRLKHRLADLERALARLNDAARLPPDTPLLVDGTIQRFEFAFELFWKTLKILLEQEHEEAVFAKQVLSKAYQAGWIDNEKLWINMLEDRNLTSHTYNEELADATNECIADDGRLGRIERGRGNQNDWC